MQYVGLQYLPNFHLIFTSITEGKYCLRLITFHGKTLDTFILKLDEEMPEKVSKLLDNLASDKLRLCQGVDMSKVDKYEHNCLIECLNNLTIGRSMRCKFILEESSDSLECDECQKIIHIKKELELMKTDKVDPIYNVRIKLDEEDDAYDPVDLDYDPDDYDNEFDEDAWGAEYDEDETFTPTKKKRGRPPKDPTKVTVKKQSGPPKSRGRPRLVLPPDEIRQIPASPKKCKVEDSSQSTQPMRCKVCLKSYKTETAINNHFKTHEQHFDTTGTAACPLCQEVVEKLELTKHFEEKHSDPTKEQQTTCCISCLEVIHHKNGDNLR